MVVTNQKMQVLLELIDGLYSSIIIVALLSNNLFLFTKLYQLFLHTSNINSWNKSPIFSCIILICFICSHIRCEKVHESKNSALHLVCFPRWCISIICSQWNIGRLMWISLCYIPLLYNVLCQDYSCPNY